MRCAVEADAALYCDLYGDPATMRFVGPPVSREVAQRRFQRVLACAGRRPIERVLLVIVEKATLQSIGIGAFQDFDTRRRRVEAGMMLRSEARGRGFGTEGLRGLVDFAFATFEVDEVWIQHAPDNMEARRVPVRLGLSHNRERESGKLTWSAQRHSWPADRSVSGLNRNAIDVKRN
jgi:RimJ/RimL family protein N-acetyltransferase